MNASTKFEKTYIQQEPKNKSTVRPAKKRKTLIDKIAHEAMKYDKD